MNIHPVVGGLFQLIIDTPDYSGANNGIFLEVEENKHIRHTWEWNSDGEVTEIDVRFEPSPKDCKIMLAHSGFKHRQNLDNHNRGWDNYIEGFTKFLQSKESSNSRAC